MPYKPLNMINSRALSSPHLIMVQIMNTQMQSVLILQSSRTDRQVTPFLSMVGGIQITSWVWQRKE